MDLMDTLITLYATQALSDEVDWAVHEDEYVSGRVTVIDDLLTPTTLAELQQYMLETQSWQDVKDGYLGAYSQHGFLPSNFFQLSFHDYHQYPQLCIP